MTVTVHDFVARLLSEYESISKKRHSKIAVEMDIPISNYYFYRSGRGNPTAKTINKMISVIQIMHPEIVIRVSVWYLCQIYSEEEERTCIAIK